MLYFIRIVSTDCQPSRELAVYLLAPSTRRSAPVLARADTDTRLLSHRMLSRRYGPRLAQRSLAHCRGLHLNHKVYPGPAATKEPPLLILHGLFGSASNFRGPAQQLCKQREVVLADLRNHGASPWDDDVSFSAAADDIAELVDSLGVPSMSLVGHSLGGKVAMLVALRRPDLVGRLCVVDIAPVQYDMAGNRGIIETLLSLPAAALGSRAEADAAMAAAASGPSDPLGVPFVRQFLLQNLVPDERSWRINLRALLDGYDELRGFPQAEVPVPEMPALFIGGEREGMLERQHWAACEGLFPKARLEMVPTGHWVHAEAPALFVQLVDTFCSEGAKV